MADDENLIAETTKIYERTHEMTQDASKFLKDVSDNLKVASYVNKMIFIATDNYIENAKYIDVLCDYIDTEAESTLDFARRTNNDSMKKYAQDMRLAAAELKTSYRNKYIAALKEIDKALLEIGIDYIKEGADKVIKFLGENCITSAFKTVDTIFFIKDMIGEITGSKDKINASTKIQASYPITLGLQYEFFTQSKNRLKDGVFSDEDYEYMKTLWELCRGAQTSNYKYLDTQSNQSWIDDALRDLDIKNTTHMSDSSYMKKYIDFAEGNFDINENIGEIDGIYDGHTYKVINVPMDFSDAKRFCESVGGYLAVINSEDERNFIGNIINSIDYRKSSYLIENATSAFYGTYFLIGSGGSLKNITSGIETGKYREFSEYKEKGGFCFVCEWDYYRKKEQTEKTLLRDKGQCGDNAFWKLTIHGDLTIYGSGPMYNSLMNNSDFDKHETAVYHSHKPLISSIYEENSKIKTITIESGITGIGCCAFECPYITEITLPESVISIGQSSFSGCSKLTRINIPKGLKFIGKYAFSGCESLKTISLGKNTRIASQSFFRCSALKSIDIPSANSYIPYGAFSKCSSLKSVTLPSTIKYIGEDAFNSCVKLSDVTLPEGVTSIKKNAFSGCSALTEINIPESVEYIGQTAFWGTGLTLLVCPKKVNTIEYGAFSQTLLEELYILNPSCTIGRPTDSTYILYNGESVFCKVYGYSGSTAEKWVNDRKRDADIGSRRCMYGFYTIDSNTKIPYNPSKKSDNPVITNPGNTPSEPSMPQPGKGKTIMYDPEGNTTTVNTSAVPQWEKAGWYTYPVATLYTPDGRRAIIKKSDVPAYEKVGWYTYPCVTVYAPDGRTAVIEKSALTAWTNVGWYSYPVTILYADDGRAAVFGTHSVKDYEKYGWYPYPITTMYAPDGRNIIVEKSKVDEWQKVGWYSYPVTVLYAADGRTAVFGTHSVKDYERFGWYPYPVVTLSAPDGRTIVVAKSEAAAWRNVGWK